VLALGTTVAVALITANFLQQSPQVSTSPEMQSALQTALELAKRDYEARKAILAQIERRLKTEPALLSAAAKSAPGAIAELLGKHDHLTITTQPIANAKPTTEGIQRTQEGKDRLELRVVVLRTDGSRVLVIVSDELSELLSIEDALQTYEHIQMFISDLQEGLVLNYVIIVVVMVVLASLIGVRIGLRITGPLSRLIRGTRELARDNLNYRIPPGPSDEIGLLIDSFNGMANDLEENRRRRVEAEKVAAWREIARRLAHEIKNPLTPIQLTVQQMRDKYPGSDERYQKLLDSCSEIVTEEVESLRGLVQEFAEFARMPQLALSPHDLNTVITDTLKLYSERKLDLNLQASLPEVRLDLEGMRGVLINLVENALDAAGADSTLVIQTREQESRVLLSIMDEGPGVADDDRERIFEPYISKKEGGTGLGLAMVRSIVEEHGGQITVSDSPTGGARFDLQFPAIQATGTQETTK